ncbi:MAG: MFS transporter [Nitrospira bacterium HGW-Nitrospira-1]|nr:MAG: MFS transporter [Nitrospira bacterium HGW-Nitrospira-1]
MNIQNPRQVISWCLFDFANSSYSAVIAAVIFPVYFVSVIAGETTGQGDLWWGRAISVSMAFVAITSPFLGGVADYSGKRKRLLFFYTLLCVLSVLSFSLLRKGMLLEGFILMVLANIGMEGGLVFYNSFLPEIAGKEYQGRVSAWGYAIGYAGSILSLLFVLPLVKNGRYHETWFAVSLFFLVFSFPAFFYLPHDRKNSLSVIGAAVKGGRYSFHTMKEILKERPLRRFMLAYFIYEDGVNTVIVFSSIFALVTLKFDATELILLYIIVQMTALAGAFLMAKPIDSWGPKKVLLLSLLIWSFVSITAFFIESKIHFWVLASIAGLGLGTVQASSRAFFTQFIPLAHESEYFGMYSLAGKSSAIMGPLLFGAVSSAFGSQRPAILAVSVFFIAGLLIIRHVHGGGPNIREGAE